MLGAWKIPIQYSMIMFLPIHQFHEPLIMAAPFLLAVGYVVSKAQSETLKNYNEYLRDSLDETQQRDGVIYSRMNIVVLFLGLICACHYLI